MLKNNSHKTNKKSTNPNKNEQYIFLSKQLYNIIIWGQNNIKLNVLLISSLINIINASFAKIQGMPEI